MPAEAAVVGSLDRLEDSFPRWRIHVAGKLASQCKPLAGELSSPPHGPLHRAIGVSSQCSCWIPPEQMISLRRMPWCLLRLSFRSLTPSFHDIVLATQVSCAQLGKGLLLKRCDYQEARSAEPIMEAGFHGDGRQKLNLHSVLLLKRRRNYSR